MTVTARNLITRSMQNIGALVKNEPPSADEADDALAMLNAMLSSWANDSLIIYARTTESFPLTAATSYTMGPSGTLNTVRPLNIVAAYVTQGSIDYTLGIVDDETYASIAYKAIRGIPQFLNFSNAYPLATVKLYPLDNSQTLTIISEKVLTSFPTLDTVVSLPEGWEDAICYNLSLRLAPQYVQQIDPIILQLAKESLGALRTKVLQVRNMDAFPQTLQIRNIFSGWRY